MRTLWTGIAFIAFRTLGSTRTGIAFRSLRSWWTDWTLGTYRSPRIAFFSFRACFTLFPFWARWTWFAGGAGLAQFTFRAWGTSRSRWPDFPSGARRTNGPSGSLGTRGQLDIRYLLLKKFQLVAEFLNSVF
jgi:hypothetical protein